MATEDDPTDETPCLPGAELSPEDVARGKAYLYYSASMNAAMARRELERIEKMIRRAAIPAAEAMRSAGLDRITFPTADVVLVGGALAVVSHRR